MYYEPGKIPHGLRKDTVINVDRTGQFVWNMATYALRNAANLSSQDVLPEVDEFMHAGLGKLPSRHVRPPRIARAFRMRTRADGAAAEMTAALAALAGK